MGKIGQPGHVRQQAFSRGALLREYAPAFDRLIGETLNREVCLNTSRVFTFGCGDSHNTGMTARMAFQHWTGLPMQAQTALEFARYTTPWLGDSAPSVLAVGTSVSGEVARTVEGVSLAREAGANCLGITCNSESRIANLAQMSVDVSVPEMDIPRVRAYLATQLALYMVALRLGEVRGKLDEGAAQAIRDHVQRAADIGDATCEAVSETVRQLAGDLKDRQHLLFVGGGPNYGSAMFGAAKILEAAGVSAQPQDLEEWVHLQYFGTGQSVVFLIAPPGIGYSRAVEVAPLMKRMDAFVVAVVAEDDTQIAPIADVVLPVKGHLPEELTPLVYTNAIEMFASDLPEAHGEPYFRGFEGRWHEPEGSPTFVNEVLESRAQLQLGDLEA